ncbi:MAG: primosomal protein N' [Clostridiales bacterium]|nr:primosomal protein N' [Clostridiales bacterium]
MFAKVIIDQDAKALDRVFEYIIPEETDIDVGARVYVPFGSRILQGYVIKISGACEYDQSKLKSIISAIDEQSVIKKELLALMHFMVKKNHLKYSSTLRLFLPSEMREGKVKELFATYYCLNENCQIEISLRAKKQIEIIEFLKQNGKTCSAILKDNFGASAVKSLFEKGVILQEKEQVFRAPEFSPMNQKKVCLNEYQQNAIDSICDDKTYLLHGVTGSGKTEVYMNLIERELAKGKNAIMLVPEISLTPQIMSNFKSRFGDLVALLHSGLSAGERFDEWKRLYSGQARIAIGARSAIFAPLENLGIIIIDEEHEQSYISESNPRYDTHDVASFRARTNQCPLVLGSATPSIDSYKMAKEGEYQLIELPVRANGKEMPVVETIDMMNELRAGNSGIFSNKLLAELVNVVNSNKQAMIFINRRGYSSFMRCRECGYIAKCCDCDVSLVYHKEDNRLKCHYCGKQYRVLSKCPKCGSDQIKQGAIGTEQVADKLKEMFPSVNILRMDNDTTTTKNSHQKILEEFKNSKPGILVGTQMIAKGHDFEDVILVGIVDGDQTLYHTDYRSTERTFQLITQVAGRAGRSQNEGKVILQTYSPKHYVYKFASNYDYKGFYRKEINVRETAQFPPYTRIIRILFSDINENNVRELLKICYTEIEKLKAKYGRDIIYLDAMKSPVQRVQGKYRYQIMMRLNLQHADAVECEAFEIVDKASKTSVFFEINPQNLS